MTSLMRTGPLDEHTCEGCFALIGFDSPLPPAGCLKDPESDEGGCRCVMVSVTPEQRAEMAAAAAQWEELLKSGLDAMRDFRDEDGRKVFQSDGR